MPAVLHQTGMWPFSKTETEKRNESNSRPRLRNQLVVIYAVIVLLE